MKSAYLRMANAAVELTSAVPRVVESVQLHLISGDTLVVQKATMDGFMLIGASGSMVPAENIVAISAIQTAREKLSVPELLAKIAADKKAAKQRDTSAAAT